MIASKNFIIKNIKFSRREIDIISYAIKRISSKEIGAILDISPNTVKNHVTNILKKINGACRKDIIHFVNDSDYFEIFPEQHKTIYGHNISSTNIKTKNRLLQNVFLVSWIVILLLYICDFIKF